MRLQFRKDRSLNLIFVFLIVLLVSLIACLLLLRYVEGQQIQAEHERYDDYKIAQELRSTSEELTTQIRMYVVTGQKKYLDHYLEIRAIRDGTAPHPQHYDWPYWDLVTDDKRPRPSGPPKSFQQELAQGHFTQQELGYLQQALDRSNGLNYALSVEAINAMQGKFDNGTGTYSMTGPADQKLAINLVFGQQYMQEKANIMQSIVQFFQSINERTAAETQKRDSQATSIVVIAIVLAIVSAIFLVISILRALRTISRAAETSELLLLNVLPSKIAARLKEGQETIVDENMASILFIDIVKFTELTAKLGAEQIVKVLSDLYDEFDDLTTKYGVEKIKTIGDNYMAVAGVPELATDHAQRLADFALAVRDKIGEFNQRHDLTLQVRMGMTCGTVVAGIIGHKKFIYDIWGDVVNVASRMESTSLPGEIQVTEKMALLIEEQFILEPRPEPVDVKGKGLMKTFFLKSRRTAS